MEKFRTLKPVSLHSGEVGLTKEQYDRRKPTGALRETDKKGVYEIVKPICLKTGELFFYSGDEGKKLTHSLELVEKKKSSIKEIKK